MIRHELRKLIKKAVKEEFERIKIPEIKVEKPENKEFGDYSTNIALQLAKILKQKPMEIAERLVKMFHVSYFMFHEAKAVKPGFINFYLSGEYLQKKVGEILEKGKKFGDLNIGKNKKVNLEFISANPTGPLTLGNGRGGFCGDVLANVLEKAGYKVRREYYINDVGEQIRKLGHSIVGDSEAVYKGKYIDDLRKRIRGKNPVIVGEKGANLLLEKMIKPAVKEMGINFDVWFSEKSLYKTKKVDKILNFLKKKKLSYEKDSALWFRSTKYGDEKDRVLIKKDGEKTYLASDIAYLKNKFERGFDKLIYIWGADHYGYIERIKAAAQALGYKKEQVDIIIMQLVSVMWTGEGKKEFRKMSKRQGIYWGLDKLIKELGKDVVRFFFLTRSPGSHLIFDLELAKEQSQKNPVFYIQYAYARISSILSKIKAKNIKKLPLSKLSIDNLLYRFKFKKESESNLIKQLIRLPEIVEDTAKDYQVQRLPNYALELVTVFHKFYEECRVISEDKQKTQARLGLVRATKIVLKNLLDLMGISAPEKM